MEERTLQFDSIIDLLDFETEIKPTLLFVNRTKLTVIGKFDQAEIELAKRAYNATVIDNEEAV